MTVEQWGIIGDSPKIKDVLRIIEQVAPTDVTVLIQGESGTGKELVAQAIHRRSERRTGELIPVNCGAIPEGILESELFGHEKGAFTGATGRRKGYFELARDGTIFLDEIGEMSLQTQVKVLRVLESGEFMRVGGTDMVSSNARVIVATNKDLEQEVKKGNFRQDLYFRLKSIMITMPPLRGRRNDILLLIGHFIRELEQRYSIDHQEIAPEVYEKFMHYSWPGNIRELKNLLESLVLLKRGERIEVDDLPEAVKEASAGVSGLPIIVNKTSEQVERELIYGALLGLRRDIEEMRDLLHENLHIFRKRQEGYHYNYPVSDVSRYVPLEESGDNDISMDKIEMEAIREALNRYNGNRRLAANALGISERTLYRKLKKQQEK